MHLARPPALAALLSLSLGVGCEAGSDRRSAPGRTPTDKAALYGDPSLVPTRSGERARRELGLAQEVSSALELLPDVEGSRVNVESSQPSGPPDRVMVVLRGRASADVERLEAHARTIAAQVVGPEASIEVVVERDAAPPSSPVPALPWPLALGLLGLGFCSGVVVERARRIQRAPRRSAGRRRR